MKHVWQLVTHEVQIANSIDLPGSKSLSNRLLVLEYLLKQFSDFSGFSFLEPSDADDTKLMSEVLASDKSSFHLKNAGTCMRFLTAAFAAIPGKEVDLLCDDRMKHRPIQPLVDALRSFGADITYLEEPGFPPLKVKGRKLNTSHVQISSSESSQFVSALMMIGPFLDGGLELEILGEPMSASYIHMTASLMQQLGFSIRQKGNAYLIEPFVPTETNSTFTAIEKDWSSAAFFLEYLGIKQKGELYFSQLNPNSLQGDKMIISFIENFGVKLKKSPHGLFFFFDSNAVKGQDCIDLSSHPDLAPALICLAAVKQVPIQFIGLQSLNLKESRRLDALQHELGKLGYQFEGDANGFSFQSFSGEIRTPMLLDTYNDHRLVMAFSMLAFAGHQLFLSEVSSVEKSFPNFWIEASKIGLEAKEIITSWEQTA